MYQLNQYIMASHKKTESNQIIKTFSFKIKNANGLSLDVLNDAITEYQNYYNICSDWIKDHLTMKIGELYKYIPDEKKNSGYALTLISDEWKDKPMYMMFKKGYPANNRDNAIYETLNTCNTEHYTGNILNFSDTYYRRFGYVASTISNYVTKISKMSTGSRSKNISNDSDVDTIMEQVIYEMEHNGWTSVKDWENQMEYLESKTDSNPNFVYRMTTLYEFYKSHIDEVNSKMETMSIDSLIKFGGCRRKDSKKSMYIMGGSNTPFDITQIGGNSLNIKFSKNLNVDVFGRYDVIKDNTLLVDIINGHGASFVLKIINGEIYIDINVSVPFDKKIATTNKVVGIDVNIKHMLLATNILDDGNVKGYVNIYKEVINDSDFKKVCNSTVMKYFTDFSKFVTFCPLEFDFLFSRVCNQKGIYNDNSAMEKSFSDVLNKLKWNFIETGDNTKRIYIENVMKLRSQMKAYAIVKNAYYKQQSEYDFGKSEEFIQEHPFSNTDKGIEILNKLDNISKKILGCRNNIIQYSYNLFEINGYDMISLEKLTSSQFKKKPFPTVNSLLKYHKILGCTQEEMEKKDIYSVIKKGYYDIIFDNDVVTDAKLSAKGELSKFKDDFFNLMIKSIHFADIKDYFITLSNNGVTGVSLVPSYFTSQMDSIDHKIYFVQDNKSGKLKLANKHKVRSSQEKHINGLNADYNAARNIAYIMENTECRNMFMKQSRTDKSLYNKPSYETFIKTQGSAVAKLKKEGFVKILDEASV